MKNAKTILAENKQWVEETFKKLDEKLVKMAVRSKDVVADGVDENGRHIDRAKNLTGWTNGFWGGLNYLMYEHTKRPEYLACGNSIEKIMDGCFEKFEGLHHDVGFMWHILSGANYRITGDPKSLQREYFMATTLAARFNIDGGFITAWNGQDKQNWTIIDTLMNLPLLYYVSEKLGDDRFKRIAMAQADTALCDHVRDDGSVAHIVEHDRETGEVVRTYGGQGIAEGSSWSRGQSWAVYGLVLSYLHTGEQKYLDGAKSVANYFIANCCDDWLPRIDFRAPEEPTYYDSTAGLIAACGMIELAKILPENEGGMYMNAAIHLIRAIADAFGNWEEDKDFIIGYGSARYPVDGDLKKAGVHISIIYADYFFAEALLKLLGSEFNPW